MPRRRAAGRKDGVVRARDPERGSRSVEQGAAIRARHHRLGVGDESLGAVVVHDRPAPLEQVGSVQARGMERRGCRARHRLVTAGTCHRDRFAALGCLQRRAGARRRADQRNALDALGRTLQHRHRDIAAEREAAQPEALWRVGQHRVGECFDAVQRRQVRAVHAQACGQVRDDAVEDRAGIVKPRQQEQVCTHRVDAHRAHVGIISAARCSPRMRSPSTQQACVPTEMRSGRMMVASGPREMSAASSTRHSERSCFRSVTNTVT